MKSSQETIAVIQKRGPGGLNPGSSEKAMSSGQILDII